MVFLAVSIFIVTLSLVIWQPKGLSIGWTAIGGAVVALATGVVSIHDVWSVTQIVWDATLALVGIIMISMILDRIGFFEWAALNMAHAAKGNGCKVFLAIASLGALVSALFNNDGAALILTPIVLEKVRLMKFDLRKVLPFVLASGFIADTTSLPLVISNLVNIVSADYFRVGFLSYALHMIVPDLFSFGASVLVLYLFFHKDIPRHYNPSDLPFARHAIKHLGLFRVSWVILVILLVGYALTEAFHVPVSVVALFMALVFLVVGGRTRFIAVWPIITEAPWSIVVFSIGMYVVVYGLQNVGLTTLLGHAMAWSATGGIFTGILFVGFLAAILSSVMNNLPTVMIDALAIHASATTGVMHEAMVYANVIGCDLGPKMTPIGSLATLLWLHVLAKKNVTIAWGWYVRTCVVLTIPTLFVTLTGLYVWLTIVH